MRYSNGTLRRHTDRGALDFLRCDLVCFLVQLSSYKLLVHGYLQHRTDVVGDTTSVLLWFWLLSELLKSDDLMSRVTRAFLEY